MEVALQPILLSVAWYLVIAFSPLLALIVGMRASKVVEAVKDRRAIRRRAGQPHGQPLERLVADLWRLRAELLGEHPTTNVGHTALLRAYDSVLCDLCAALEIPTALADEEPDPDVELRPDREFERLRAEAAIQEAGIPLNPRRNRAEP